MRHLVLVAALAACGNDPATPQTTPSAVAGGSGSQPAANLAAAPKPPALPTPLPDDKLAPDPEPKDTKPEPPKEPAIGGHDFTAAGRDLAIVGACVAGTVPAGYDTKLVEDHCKKVNTVQTEYSDRWVKQARAFFEERVPKTAPKKVVYPFSGGDLSTALTVYPDADEITTMSLEPAGDPRTLQALSDAATKPVGKAAKPSPVAKKALDKALGTVRYELDFLYRVNFSNTRNMIDAMRRGSLPTQLIFSISALKVHGYEMVSLRYFTLDDAGNVKYLTDEEVTAAPDPIGDIIDDRAAEKRNRVFANSEIRFRKPGGKVQIHRHLRQDLSDKELAKDPRVVKHLEAKGQIVGMTKAASYLLSWDSFATMRNYLTGHVQWMVSDATGVAPKWGTPAGFEYETYGGFTAPHLDSGNGVGRDWRELWASQPKRQLKFRFGYYDARTIDHLVIMKKKS